jgi:hypothetical protein
MDGQGATKEPRGWPGGARDLKQLGEVSPSSFITPGLPRLRPGSYLTFLPIIHISLYECLPELPLGSKQRKGGAAPSPTLHCFLRNCSLGYARSTHTVSIFALEEWTEGAYNAPWNS